MSKVIVGIGFFLWSALLPAWAQAPTIDLPSEYSTITENTLVGHRSPLQGQIETEVWQAIWSANHKYPNVPFDLLWQLADCECKLSKPTEKCIGDNGLAINRWQWHKDSWDRYNKKYSWDLDRENIQDQATMTARVLLEPDGWRNWSNCFRKQVLGDLL